MEITIAKKLCDDCIFQDRCDEGHKWSYFCNANAYDMEGMTGCADTCPVYLHIGDSNARWEKLQSLQKAKEDKEKAIIKRAFESKPDVMVKIIHRMLGNVFFRKSFWNEILQLQ